MREQDPLYKFRTEWMTRRNLKQLKSLIDEYTEVADQEQVGLNVSGNMMYVVNDSIIPAALGARYISLFMSEHPEAEPLEVAYDFLEHYGEHPGLVRGMLFSFLSRFSEDLTPEDMEALADRLNTKADEIEGSDENE